MQQGRAEALTCRPVPAQPILPAMLPPLQGKTDRNGDLPHVISSSSRLGDVNDVSTEAGSKQAKGGSLSFTVELGCGTPCCRSLLRVYSGKVGKCMGGNPLRGGNCRETTSQLQTLKG